MKKKFALLAAALAAGLSFTAQASVIIDQSPDATGFASSFTAGNVASGQNFLVRFTIASATTLTGFDIYSACRAIGCGGPNLGTTALVRIRGDVGGLPDISNLFSINTSISAIDSIGSSLDTQLERVHADFAGVALTAGSYWIGLSGDPSEIGWTYNSSTPGSLFILGGDILGGPLPGSVAYRIHDNLLTGSVPEPATWAMMLVGFGLVGAGMRRRRQSVRVTYA
jgi:hypothetical protein